MIIRRLLAAPATRVLLFFALAFALAQRLCAQSTPAANPLLTTSPLPFGYPQFDRIRDEHYTPAFEQGMREHLAEVEAIAANPAPAGFENTIVALERSGRL